jgi:hypothetical protein
MTSRIGKDVVADRLRWRGIIPGVSSGSGHIPGDVTIVEDSELVVPGNAWPGDAGTIMSVIFEFVLHFLGGGSL